jgi:hypothetical protein
MRPRIPSFRFPVLEFRRSGKRQRPEFVQRLLQQVNEASQLPCPFLCSRTLLLLGSVAAAASAVHIVIGLADLPVGVVLAAFGVRNVMHDVRYPVVQFVKHVCRIGRKYDRRRSVIALPHVVGAMFVGAMFVGAMFVRAVFVRAVLVGVMLIRVMFVRAMFIRVMFVRAMLVRTSFAGTSFVTVVWASLCNVFALCSLRG